MSWINKKDFDEINNVGFVWKANKLYASSHSSFRDSSIFFSFVNENLKKTAKKCKHSFFYRTKIISLQIIIEIRFDTIILRGNITTFTLIGQWAVPRPNLLYSNKLRAWPGNCLRSVLVVESAVIVDKLAVGNLASGTVGRLSGTIGSWEWSPRHGPGPLAAGRRPWNNGSGNGRLGGGVYTMFGL